MMDNPARNTRRKRTFSTSTRHPQEDLSRSQRTGDRVEHECTISKKPAINSAKRAKAERHVTRLTTKAPSIERPASVQPEDKLQVDAEAQRSSELLEGFRGDLLNIRASLTCKICTRLFFEPYTTPCGHTYCYSCLSTWFVSTHGRKSCPDCRAPVTHAPAPAYTIKDLIQIFTNRAELFPPGETKESLDQIKKEEAEVVQRDKDDKDAHRGGLFKGCFKPGLPVMMPMRDGADGVYRCPICQWELEDGSCLHCGHNFDDAIFGDMPFSDLEESDFSDEELDNLQELAEMDDWYDGQDLDYDDILADAYAHHQSRHLPRRHRSPFNWPRHANNQARARRQSLISDRTDTEEDSSLSSGFIDDRDDLSSNHSTSTARDTPRPAHGSQQSRSNRRRRVIDSDSENETSEVELGHAENEADNRDYLENDPWGALADIRVDIGDDEDEEDDSSSESDEGDEDEDVDLRVLLHDQQNEDLDDESGSADDEDTEYGFHPGIDGNTGRSRGGYSPGAYDAVDFNDTETTDGARYGDSDDESTLG